MVQAEEVTRSFGNVRALLEVRPGEVFGLPRPNLVMFLFVLGSLAPGVLMPPHPGQARMGAPAMPPHPGRARMGAPVIPPHLGFAKVGAPERTSMCLPFGQSSRRASSRWALENETRGKGVIEVLRGAMLKGVGFAVLWPHLAALLLFSVRVLFLASVRFQRQVVA